MNEWPVFALDIDDGETILLFRNAHCLLGWLAMPGTASGVLDLYQADGHRLEPVLEGPPERQRLRLLPDERGPQLAELCELLTAAFLHSGEPLMTETVGEELVTEAMTRALLP